jgi:quercetin dioxygenase-like cupin family protein
MTKGWEKKGGSPDKRSLQGATALEINGLVEYAEGAVVSRTIAKTRVGTVTLFAFDAGQELSEHSAPYDAFVHVLDGEVELTIGGKTVAAHAGELVVMPAGIPHAVKARKRFKMLLTMLRARAT